MHQQQDCSSSSMDFFLQRHSTAFALQQQQHSGIQQTTASSSSSSLLIQSISDTVAATVASSTTGGYSTMIRSTEADRNASNAMVGDSGIALVAGTSLLTSVVSSDHQQHQHSSPSRDEVGFNIRRRATNLNSNTGDGNDDNYDALGVTEVDGSIASTTPHANGRGSLIDTIRSVSFDTQIYDEVVGASAWNTDFQYPSLLLGQYVIRHRHDHDKQEVLAQVAELDLSDMLPIIVSCELSLCIYYARSILLRSCSLLLSHCKDFNMPEYLVTLEQQHLHSTTSSSSSS